MTPRRTRCPEGHEVPSGGILYGFSLSEQLKRSKISLGTPPYYHFLMYIACQRLEILNHLNSFVILQKTINNGKLMDKLPGQSLKNFRGMSM